MSNWIINQARQTDNGYRLELACDFDENGHPGQVRAFDWGPGSPILDTVDTEDKSAVIKALVEDALAQIDSENSKISSSEVTQDEDLVMAGTAVADL